MQTERLVESKHGNGGGQRLTVLARGDFGHDGIADVLVATSNQMVGGDCRTAICT